MKSKTWIIILLSTVIVTVALFATSMYLIDPLLQYGTEKDIFPYWTSTEIYSNPGIAKNYEYDSVLVGSSMVQNTDIHECNELFDCTMIKSTYSGGNSYNFKTILDVCFKSNPNIKSVYWALDPYALTTDYKTPRYPLPEYLYDFDRTNDISYLLNLDVFYFYTIKNAINSFVGNEKKAMYSGVMVGTEADYSKANILSSFDWSMKQLESKGEKYWETNMLQNLEHNILPLIKENPDTTFYFFTVPYSIGYWYREKMQGYLDTHFYNMETVISEILKYDNVVVYFYQDDKNIITDLDNYKDYSHFSPKINSYLTQQMASGNNILTLDNYAEVLDNFYEYLSTFDYEEFFTEQKDAIGNKN